MSEEGPDGDGFEARLRWLAERVGKSVEDLGEIDVNLLARLAGVEIERARELLEGAGRWLSSRTDELVDEAVSRFEGSSVAGTRSEVTSAGGGPDPRDLPTAAQGRSLSAIDSGRWAVEPGSHAVAMRGDGPAPDDAVGLVGELRVRDWIAATGELTTVGRNALLRWIELPDAR